MTEIRRVAKILTVDGFVPGAFSRTRANPGPDTVADLLRDFGVSGGLDTVEAKLRIHYNKPFATGFARQELGAIVGRRNDVAHGGSGLSIARSDLHEWSMFVHALGRAVDNTLRDHAVAMMAAL